jgi:hypothetical protein
MFTSGIAKTKNSCSSFAIRAQAKHRKVAGRLQGQVGDKLRHLKAMPGLLAQKLERKWDEDMQNDTEREALTANFNIPRYNQA